MTGKLLAVGLAGIAPFVFVTPSAVESSLSSVPFGDGYLCDSDIECEEATGYPYDVALSDQFAGRPFQRYPRLVGHGCKGAKGPIYAFEEDHFPVCREIVEMDWHWDKVTER